MQWAMAVMWRNRAARHVHRVQGGAAPKQQKNAAAADVIGTETLIPSERLQTQHVFIKARRARKIIDVNRSLDNAIELERDQRLVSPHSPHIERRPRLI